MGSPRSFTNGKKVFKGFNKGKMSGKVVNDYGAELAAALDDARVIWENVFSSPG